MHRKSTRPLMIFAVVVLATLLVLVTSIASLANTSTTGSAFLPPQQEITPTPAEADASVAGSTDGIVWMGIAITLIVLAPMLATRVVWTRQT